MVAHFWLACHIAATQRTTRLHTQELNQLVDIAERWLREATEARPVLDLGNPFPTEIQVVPGNGVVGWSGGDFTSSDTSVLVGEPLVALLYSHSII